MRIIQVFVLSFLCLSTTREDFKLTKCCFSCPRGQSVSAISYLYRQYNDDHVYNFTCSPVTEGGRESGCSWSGYTNSIFEPVNYRCPTNSYIAGVDSYFNHPFQNRRFSFKCCEDLTLMLHGCNTTDWQKTGEPLHFTVPEGTLLSAVHSQGNDQNNDWRFKFEVCTRAKYPNNVSTRLDLR
ncbi:dermatopontin-like isoform X2 [Pomacea canaliculata]|uniref:dermatopontin-like isoform X2 n=1 Tax=Pomacea canaliculata TaxID=400727 RepID=UPI000D736CC8|nr:dermatopontin-like isoform X2 [Pomacea canaliculata]